MAYSVYDGSRPTTPHMYDGVMSRPISRARSRHSFSYGSPAYSYGGDTVYDEPLMYDSYAPQSYAGYATPRYTSPASAYDDMGLTSYNYSYGTPASTAYPLSRTPSRMTLRRNSTSSSYFPRMPMGDAFRRGGTKIVKFKRKGAFRAGVSLGECLQNVRLSGNDSYTFYDLNVDARQKIYMRVTWSGYSSMTYEIPMQGYGGHIDMQALARRVARACMHYLQSQHMPLSYDRVVLHQLEEVSVGVWQPTMTIS
ncbi:hypothetical protein OE88DRAFT_697072 [Heliocybe sulcata]|uniref:DUF6741 domain-containing protein n=1 Tax=Heliocybe sulcata TaxID=5364 RepID=A0A5C3NDQ1_9AGAM|nr:hypothetical protein OE88DRAFT_697072 [Heliocybe sulcata]